jgi:hypothetical protein
VRPLLLREPPRALDFREPPLALRLPLVFRELDLVPPRELLPLRELLLRALLLRLLPPERDELDLREPPRELLLREPPLLLRDPAPPRLRDPPPPPPRDDSFASERSLFTVRAVMSSARLLPCPTPRGGICLLREREARSRAGMQARTKPAMPYATELPSAHPSLRARSATLFVCAVVAMGASASRVRRDAAARVACAVSNRVESVRAA